MSLYFSVVIPARNEESSIGRCISSVRSSDLSDEADIVLVDDNSSDRTVAVARELGAKVLETAGSHQIGALRNMGARASGGSVIVFIDADMVVPRDWLVLARKHFTEGFQGAFGFINVPPPEAGWIANAWCNKTLVPPGTVRETAYLPGRNIFVNRSAFEKAGGFSETLLTGEDKDFCFRIMGSGNKTMISSETTLVHLDYEKGIREFARKEFWRQGNTLALAREWKYSFRTMRNPLFSLWHVIMPLCVVASLVLGAPVAGVFILLAWVLPSALIAARRSRDSSPADTGAFFLLTFIRWNAAGAALLRQLGALMNNQHNEAKA